jgi:hypothetical protein
MKTAIFSARGSFDSDEEIKLLDFEALRSGDGPYWTCDMTIDDLSLFQKEVRCELIVGAMSDRQQEHMTNLMEQLENDGYLIVMIYNEYIE